MNKLARTDSGLSVATLSNLMSEHLRSAPIERVKSAPVVVKRARTTRKPRERELSASDVRVLYRTRLVADIGKRVFTHAEIVEYTAGRDTSTAQWSRLKRLGYVAETRGGPKLTPKGIAKLKELGK